MESEYPSRVSSLAIEHTGQVIETIEVVGCEHEQRDRIVRTLMVGVVVFVKKKVWNKKAGLGVFWRDRQIGWIPDDIGVVVSEANFIRCRIQSLGTGYDGRWTRATIQCLLGKDLDPIILSHGLVVAGVYKSMDPKNLEAAQRMAQLPRTERRAALEEWHLSHLTTERAPRKRKTITSSSNNGPTLSPDQAGGKDAERGNEGT